MIFHTGYHKHFTVKNIINLSCWWLNAVFLQDIIHATLHKRQHQINSCLSRPPHCMLLFSRGQAKTHSAFQEVNNPFIQSCPSTRLSVCLHLFYISLWRRSWMGADYCWKRWAEAGGRKEICHHPSHSAKQRNPPASTELTQMSSTPSFVGLMMMWQVARRGR